MGVVERRRRYTRSDALGDLCNTIGSPRSRDEAIVPFLLLLPIPGPGTVSAMRFVMVVAVRLYTM